VRFVVSHLEMVGFGGTESYVLTVAEGLERLGHDVVIHTPQIGPSGHFARERGLRVDARLRQPIDLQRFCFQTLNAEQRRPPRVLLLSNYTKGVRARMIEQACAAAGLELVRVGAKTTATPTPEHDIAGAEIVLSLGRGALEAMAGGRAGYVLGDAGGDGWVTAENYPALEADGFSGRAFDEPIGVDKLASNLASWSEELARLVRLEWSQATAVRQAVARTDAERARVRELEAEIAALRDAMA
jgi:hypothetical protein